MSLNLFIINHNNLYSMSFVVGFFFQVTPISFLEILANSEHHLKSAMLRSCSIHFTDKLISWSCEVQKSVHLFYFCFLSWDEDPGLLLKKDRVGEGKGERGTRRGRKGEKEKYTFVVLWRPATDYITEIFLLLSLCVSAAVLGFYCCDKTPSPNATWGCKSLLQPTTLRSKSINEGNQCMNSR